MSFGWTRPFAAFALTLAAVALPRGDAHAYTFKVIHDFCSKSSCRDGSEPQAALVMDAAGNLYGTTQFGGTIGNGTVFKLSFDAVRSRWVHSIIHNFCSDFGEATCRDGSQPLSSLILDTAGNLYGTTRRGGAISDFGIVYKLLASEGGKSPPLEVLHAFCPDDGNCHDGIVPASSLSYAGLETGAPYDGVSPLYGTTSLGEPGAGIVFQLTTDGSDWTLTPVHEFCRVAPNCTDGQNPVVPPIVTADGTLYGSTSSGGSRQGRGLVYKFTPDGSGWDETKLRVFCSDGDCRDGADIESGVIFDGAGNLLGTTVGGGRVRHACCGTLFQLSPNGANPRWTHTILYNFCTLRNCRDGKFPSGPLIQGAAGAVYGTTQFGGGFNIDEQHQGGGTVFRYFGGALHTAHKFCSQADCADGKYPISGVIMDAAGNLFGTTTKGGKFDEGVVFELSP